MTDSLTKLKRLHEAATPGPWFHYKAKLRPNFPTVINEVQDGNGNAVIKWAGFDCVDGRTKKETASNTAITAYLRNHASDFIRLIEAATEATKPDGDVRSCVLALSDLRDALKPFGKEE